MLGKGFFYVKPFNPNPYPDPVIVNLSGGQKFEDDTVFLPGRYKIEVAPGRSIVSAPYMEHIETITEPFIVRAYCGGDSDSQSYGINPYSGPFKVNGMTGYYEQPGIDVNHIFGAGGGNGFLETAFGNSYILGGGNCLGNGTPDISFNFANTGAGSCLHLLPVGGTFGTDYLRAYHMCAAGSTGSAYGGAAGAVINRGSGWHGSAYRGGNSPYGNGGQGSIYGDYTNASGTGIGSSRYVLQPDNSYTFQGAGAYFDGTNWIDEPGTNVTLGVTGHIRITYLGPLNEEVYYAWGSNPSVKETRVFTENLNPQVGDPAWFFDFDNTRTSYDIKDATQVTIQSSGTGVAPIVWVDNTGFYAAGTLGPAIYTLNRMSNDDIIIKW